VAAALEGLGEVGLSLCPSPVASPSPPSDYADALAAILAIHTYRYRQLHLPCSRSILCHISINLWRSSTFLCQLNREKYSSFRLKKLSVPVLVFFGDNFDCRQRDTCCLRSRSPINRIKFVSMCGIRDLNPVKSGPFFCM
jgi:hypothetical protein